MKVSANVIKALAIGDMVSWVSNFENDGEIDNYDQEIQDKYWEYIKKLQEKILKEL